MVHNQTELINKQNDAIKELTNRWDQQQEDINKSLQ
ncbi:hypothetical protein J2Z64_002937 [Oceanobacillus polygoni]|uniref:Uncharacterized protein n=1 Tax=Oceanobacillus polygoni TaxID=1235259 RepID=A0A9X1CIU3_9BACI|nr:hypothetical protein [Oceanobacillus polygoni]